MLAFILRRLLLMIPTTLGVAAVVFGIYHLAPGDPATVMMGMGSGGQMATDSDSASKIDAFRIKHGLDRNPVIQFLDYIGPVNLSRDGCSLFSSPYGERKVEEVELPDGTLVREGKPLPIEYLPDTPEGERGEMEDLRQVLLDDTAGDAAWSDAVSRLKKKNESPEGACLPVLMTSLQELRLETDSRGPTIERVGAALETITGHEPQLHPIRVEQLGQGARIRSWFRWYYEEGGGSRVRNTGENTWGGLLCLDLGNEMQSNTPVAPELLRLSLIHT